MLVCMISVCIFSDTSVLNIQNSLWIIHTFSSFFLLSLYSYVVQHSPERLHWFAMTCWCYFGNNSETWHMLTKLILYVSGITGFYNTSLKSVLHEVAESHSWVKVQISHQKRTLVKVKVPCWNVTWVKVWKYLNCI